MADLIDVNEAAKILGLGGTQTRAVLGEPDEIDIIPTGQAKHLFFRCRVEEVRRRRECDADDARNVRRTVNMKMFLELSFWPDGTLSLADQLWLEYFN